MLEYVFWISEILIFIDDTKLEGNKTF